LGYFTSYLAPPKTFLNFLSILWNGICPNFMRALMGANRFAGHGMQGGRWADGASAQHLEDC
jgi:hypothetical protein